MVADWKATGVPWSRVKVPGTGWGHGGVAAAPAVSCDLGRVSSLAASIPVTPFLLVDVRPRLMLNFTTTHVCSREPVAVFPGTQPNGDHERPNPTPNRRVVTASVTSPHHSKSIEELEEELRSLREERRLLQQQVANYIHMSLERERRLFEI